MWGIPAFRTYRPPAGSPAPTAPRRSLRSPPAFHSPPAFPLASQSSGASLSPATQLKEAVNYFQRILTEDQRTAL